MKRLAWVMLVAVVIGSCSKKGSFSGNSATFTSQVQIQANDQIRLSTELDAAFNDVDSALLHPPSVCGGGISIDSVDTPRVITIGYNGKTCDAQRSRVGSITISSSPGTTGNKAGDSVTVAFNTLVITRLSDSKTLSLNGTFTYRNLSGGSLGGLSTGKAGPVVHTLAGFNISVTYDDGTLTRWQFTRQRTYTYAGGMLISTLGLNSVGGLGGVADWGANRFGNRVLMIPITPFQISQGCGWRTTGGQVTLNNPIGVTTLTFGLDSSGKPTGCPVAGGRYYYSLSWTGEEQNPYSILLAY